MTGRVGGIVVATGELDPIRVQAGNPHGASPPDETALAAARFQGRRVAEVAAKLAGVPELVAAERGRRSEVGSG